MLTLDQIREALKDRNRAAVARNLGISAATLQRLANGSKVSYPVYEKLSQYLERKLPEQA